MLYSALTDTELERWVYSKPGDKEAAAEMLRRSGGLAAQIHELKYQVDDLESELCSLEDENDALKAQLDEFETVGD